MDPTPPDLAPALDRLSTAQREWLEAKAFARHATKRRAEATRTARAAGATWHQVALRLGVSDVQALRVARDAAPSS
jgi:hypothetical protein